ncbi:hypothetical protein JTB14_006612 [Gonioctena quinquepunctata]|nr:hypothetical protein JTB14_006612 [Gonioctena quinquepunctata]
MSTQEFLKQYKKDVTNIRNRAKNLGLSETEINISFKDAFVDLRKEINSSKPTAERTKAQKICTIFKNLFLLFALIFIVVYILLNVHQPTSSIVLRNVQGLTYPTLKFVRFLSVPIIRLFPSLTDLYDESCLLENPYFYVADMECWPCESVHAVLNITKVDEGLLKSGSGTPFVVKIDQKLVTIETLQKMYEENTDVLQEEERKFKSINPTNMNLKDIFSNNVLSSKTHISWRITKMTPARLIRQIFPKPFFLPDRSGQSVERFLMVDGSKAEPYLLPNTECSYIFMIQGSGERTIILRPSRECATKCRTVSVLLKPSHVLWYNWWYWRPISLPTKNSTKPSISYINSYC